jgi:hypothetical protein
MQAKAMELHWGNDELVQQTPELCQANGGLVRQMAEAIFLHRDAKSRLLSAHRRGRLGIDGCIGHHS